mmetsp:Transcript_141387/g.451902  ORF Transcript_141387/g.451902 Transcript_141387/m.451902 type:complete len:215 (+) Transcript_141387:181-825(+)
MDAEALGVDVQDWELQRRVTQMQAVARGRQTRQRASERFTDEQQGKLAKAQHHSEARRVFFRDVHEVLGVSKDAYNSNEKLQKAYAYLEQHQIQRMLEGLLAQAVLERPADLRQYLIETIKAMKANKGTPSMGCFTDEDLETMFDMWDELKLGRVPVSKVAETLRALGCSTRCEEAVVESVAGEGAEQVDKPTFVKIVRSQLEGAFSSPAFFGK